MFATFKSSCDSDTPLTVTSTPRPRAKRAQVRRACDRCRLARVKCDASKPCHNCSQSGLQCVTDGREEFKGLASATSEVERLRRRVRELEASDSPPSPASSSNSHDRRLQSSQWKWKGVSVDGLRYGPLSDHFFVRRLSDYVKVDAWVPPPPPKPECGLGQGGYAECDRLGRSQQDYYLDVFWTGHHVYHPIIDEGDFRQVYASLWPDEGPRRSHPLVDIVMALNIQYAYPLMVESEVWNSAAENAKPAGQSFFCRCQHALDTSLDRPTLVAAQSRFFSAIYLANQGSYNAAHAKIAMAEQILSSLTVDEDGSPRDRELFRRLQTCVRSQDIRFSLKLGRVKPKPGGVYSQELSSHVTATEADSGFSWVTFHRQLFLLSEMVEDIARAFMDKVDQLLANSNSSGDAFYSDPAIRNECAQFMRRQLGRLRGWLEQVPAQLKTARVAPSAAATADESFSTSQCALKLAEDDPLWLQRQRLDLECQYHDFCVTLLRPFLCFSPTPTRGTFDSDANCVSCVSHAIAVTGMLSQVMHSTDVLTGCCQAFEWQQNAAWALAGFACGYPICARSPTARVALGRAGAVFGRVGASAPAASAMRAVAQALEAKSWDIIRGFRDGVKDVAATTTTNTPENSRLPSLAMSSSGAASTVSPGEVNSAVNLTTATGLAPMLQQDSFPDIDLMSNIGTVWDTEMDLGREWWPESQGTAGPDLWNMWMHDFDSTGVQQG